MVSAKYTLYVQVVHETPGLERTNSLYVTIWEAVGGGKWATIS